MEQQQPHIKQYIYKRLFETKNKAHDNHKFLPKVTIFNLHTFIAHITISHIAQCYMTQCYMDICFVSSKWQSHEHFFCLAFHDGSENPFTQPYNLLSYSIQLETIKRNNHLFYLTYTIFS